MHNSMEKEFSCYTLRERYIYTEMNHNIVCLEHDSITWSLRFVTVHRHCKFQRKSAACVHKSGASVEQLNGGTGAEPGQVGKGGGSNPVLVQTHLEEGGGAGREKNGQLQTPILPRGAKFGGNEGEGVLRQGPPGSNAGGRFGNTNARISKGNAFSGEQK